MLPLVGVVLVVLGLVLRGEMKTDEALPSIGAFRGTEKGRSASSSSRDLPVHGDRRQAEPPWKVPGRMHREIEPGGVDVIEVRPSRGGQDPLRLRLSIEVEGEGGWVQTLDVEREDDASKRS